MAGSIMRLSTQFIHTDHSWINISGIGYDITIDYRTKRLGNLNIPHGVFLSKAVGKSDMVYLPMDTVELDTTREEIGYLMGDGSVAADEHVQQVGEGCSWSGVMTGKVLHVPKCPRCDGDTNPGFHSCSYAVEIHGDLETCSCCDACTEQCAWDI